MVIKNIYVYMCVGRDIYIYIYAFIYTLYNQHDRWTIANIYLENGMFSITIYRYIFPMSVFVM